MQNGKRQVQEEKQAIQEMISDISHQVKTPVTNLKMYNSTLLERQLTPEKAREFHELMESQIDKLDFLMQAMVKMSRLETGVITLAVSSTPIYDTIGVALSGIERTAEQRKIEITVDCDPATVERWEMATKIDITDTGRGIPEQHYAQIFKRFYREYEVHDIDGVGVGLYLCREIISKQGGYIQVKSEIGKGSTFSVFLPNERQL
jgi:signal transduction histidine kinase